MNLFRRVANILRCFLPETRHGMVVVNFKGFNDNIYHGGYLSKMPDFEVYPLLEFRKRTARSHGIKKNGNC